MLKESRNRKIAYIIAGFLMVLSLCGCMEKEKELVTYVYTETQEYIQNPYQGPYFQFYTTEPEKLAQHAKERPDCTMVLVAFNLEDEYSMEQIPTEKMEDLRNTLKEAETLGLSVIVRAAYDFSGEKIDPEFSVMLSHIEQMATVINEHKTCVAGVQAGMIGPFGEWNNSVYMEDKTYRLQVIEKWLQELDEDVSLSVRRQKFIREAKEAGIDTKRIGVYNDGLFSSDSDLGTYAEDYDRAEDLQWSQDNLQVPFNGGEMPYVSDYTNIENVVKEADSLNLSYLNREYHWDVWDLWESQSYDALSADAYIKKYLGSRIHVENLHITENYYEEEEIEVILEIKNTGFAMVNPNYKASIIYTHNGKEIRQSAELNMVSKREGTISAIITNPYFEEEIEEATLEVQIFRQAESDIKEEYCIRLANEEVSYKQGKNLMLTYNSEADE